MDIAQFQAWGYLFLTGLMVFVLYSYIYHLYSSERKGKKHYEKYSDIALHDEITDTPVEEVSKKEIEGKDS